MKRIHFLPFTAALLFLSLCGSGVAGTIRGHVLGADGRPAPAADVHLYSYQAALGTAPALATVHAGSDGSFTLDVPEGLAFTLVATGVDHNYASITLPAPEGAETVGVEIKLSRLPYTSTIDTVMIIGDWNGFSFERAATMKRQANGTYVYEVKAPGKKEVSYQLMGIVGEGEQRLGRSVNGPAGLRYDYDGAGDYRTVAAVKNGKARIVFDPATLPRTGSGQPANFTFGGAHDWMNRVAAISTTKERIKSISAEQQAVLLPIVLKAQQNGVPPDTNELRAAVAPFQGKLAEAMRSLRTSLSDPHPTVRAFAAMTAAEQARSLDTAFALDIIRALPPDNPLWRLTPNGLMGVGFRLPSTEWNNYQATVERNPWRGAGLRVLVGKMMEAGYAHREEEAERLYEKIIRDYAAELQEPESQEFADMLTTFNPNRAIKVGKQIPDFQVTLMDGGTASRASLIGKTYMIDFWAVWCGPCRAELPGLHAAYDKYKSRGLSILSLSFDQKPADVTKFRKGAKTPMPWMHSFIEEGFNNPLAKAFEVGGIPKPILVGPDGTIIAVEGELRGGELEKTLERYLPEDHAAR